MRYESEHYLFMMDNDFVVEFDIEITDLGHAGSWDEPAEGPEFEIRSVTIRRDMKYGVREPEHTVTGAQEQFLIQHFWGSLCSDALDVALEERYDRKHNRYARANDY
jgi:hypothetical protein